MGKANRRFYRTLFLGLAAMLVLIWGAIDQFGISTQEMTELFLGTVLVAGAVIVCAALFTLVWVGLRKVMRRDNAN